MLHQIGRRTRRSVPGLNRCPLIRAQKASPSLGTKHSLRSARGEVLQCLERHSRKPEKGHSIRMIRGSSSLGSTPSEHQASRSSAIEKQQSGSIGGPNLTRQIYPRLVYNIFWASE